MLEYVTEYNGNELNKSALTIPKFEYHFTAETEKLHIFYCLIMNNISKNWVEIS